ncbi:hypothetical protein KU43P_26150 [Pseudomonas sp. KU43P]|nr:hypothetical protein KU43P_26150 [Pseudomonas sp. KU43P]
MLLDTELQGMSLATATLAAGLGRGREIALALVLLQGLGHGGLLNVTRVSRSGREQGAGEFKISRAEKL